MGHMSLRVLFVMSAALVVIGAACGEDLGGPSGRSASPSTTSTGVTAATMAEHEDQHGDGMSDDSAVGGPVIEVDMVEFAFEGEPFEVPVGAPVTFRFSNTGALPHEAMFGSAHQQEEFAASGEGHGRHGDGDGDGEQGHHGDVKAITVEPGETGEITVTFDEPGEVFMGCHIPGHFDAGMVAPLTVI